jgi:hypothetical protein
MEQGLLRGSNIMLPEFDFQEKKRTGFTLLNAPKSGVVGQACQFCSQLHAETRTGVILGLLDSIIIQSSFLQRLRLFRTISFFCTCADFLLGHYLSMASSFWFGGFCSE